MAGAQERPHSAKAVIGCLQSRGGIHSRTTMIKKHYGKLIPSNAKQMTSHVSEPMGFGKGLKR
jgi:hypothetical protein